jgi:hypothetical protein
VTFGHVIAVAALYRLEASFEAAEFLIRKGLLFETWSLFRLVFEQLAWIYEVYARDDESIYHVKPTKCVGKFKNFIIKGGFMYGKFSEFAHIDPGLLSNYIQLEKGKHLLNITTTHKQEGPANALLLLFLVSLFGFMFEVVHMSRLRKFEYLYATSDGVRLADGIKRVLLQYRDSMNALQQRCPSPPSL